MVIFYYFMEDRWWAVGETTIRCHPGFNTFLLYVWLYSHFSIFLCMYGDMSRVLGIYRMLSRSSMLNTLFMPSISNLNSNMLTSLCIAGYTKAFVLRTGPISLTQSTSSGMSSRHFLSGLMHFNFLSVSLHSSSNSVLSYFFSIELLKL